MSSVGGPSKVPGDFSLDDNICAPPPLESDCQGLPRRLWATQCVQMQNDAGALIAEGICHSINSNLVVGATGPLGDKYVAIHISKVYPNDEMSEDTKYTVRAWPILLVYYNDSSLSDHEKRANYNCVLAMRENPMSRHNARPYSTSTRRPPNQHTTKVSVLLTKQSINSVSSQIHWDCDGRKVVTLDGVDVCLPAWMHIMGVSETTFYRYAGYSKAKAVASVHGNTSLQKPRSHTSQATATLRCILEKSADYMPHRSKRLRSGKKVVSRVLPATWTWKESIPNLNSVNKAFGLKLVFTASLSKVRRDSFAEFDAKKPRDNFACCSTCDRYNSLQKSTIPRTEGSAKWARKLSAHLQSARDFRELYYANCYRSKFYLNDCVTIMHDKMDHAKTASPAFSHKTKQLDGLMKMSVFVIGMLAHGHGNVRYAHYGLDVYSHDSNYTIGSFAKLLQDLELPPKSSTRK